MENLKETFKTFLTRMDELGGDARELVFDAPATENEVQEVEAQLGYGLPPDFRNVLLTLSKHCEFKWFLPDEFELPDEFDEIFCGEIHWGIQFIVPFNENKDGWVKTCFPNPENAYDVVWHNKFVFQEVGNGDFLSIDLNPATYGQIVYLSHDDGEGHGYLMAKSFTELLNNWSSIGCPGGEDWQWLPFVHDGESGIDPRCPNAVRWLGILGMK